MYIVNTYEQIEQKEKELNENHIIILLFVRPTVCGAEDIIKEFNYIHYDSSKYCSIYAVGYTNELSSTQFTYNVIGVDGADWYFSDEDFIDFKNKPEDRLKWRYSGENELIVLQSNIEGNNILNYQNYVAININEGLRKEYIPSYSMFMASLIRNSKSEVKASNAVKKTYRLKKRQIVEMALEEIQKVPTPVKRLLKNRIFFKTSKAC
ncbi:MAG: hypothetical protein HDT43_08920 [Ruminococcaceae bacterium]|nr:hypothetical protein [Oscillospiraceae bacterium]